LNIKKNELKQQYRMKYIIGIITLILFSCQQNSKIESPEVSIKDSHGKLIVNKLETIEKSV